MKKALVIAGLLLTVVLSLLGSPQPATAILMDITDGTYYYAAGGAAPISGYVDFYQTPPNISFFTYLGMDVFLTAPIQLSLDGPGDPSGSGFWVVNCLLFSALGVVVGMRAKTHEDTANFSNFFIMPMAFFCGTFFPIEQMPWVLRGVVTVLPLTHTNELLRHPVWTLASLSSLGVLLAFSAACLALGTFLVKRYSE